MKEESHARSLVTDLGFQNHHNRKKVCHAVPFVQTPMLSFPDIVGPYEVGATTFALPLRSPSVIGSAKLRHGTEEGLRPALKLEEVAFTAFYPADTSENTGFQKSSKGIDWLVRSVEHRCRCINFTIDCTTTKASVNFTSCICPLSQSF